MLPILWVKYPNNATQIILKAHFFRVLKTAINVSLEICYQNYIYEIGAQKSFHF